MLSSGRLFFRQLIFRDFNGQQRLPSMVFLCYEFVSAVRVVGLVSSGLNEVDSVPWFDMQMNW